MLHHFIRNRFRLCFTALMLFFLSGTFWNSLSFAQPSRDELKVAVETFNGFDAVRYGGLSISTAIVVNTVLEPLFYMDEKGKLVPALGLTAIPSNDGKTWTVTLRKGVLFHDGTPFTADAVKAHWTRLLGPKSRFRAYITPLRAVEKVDSHTVLFHLKHPWAAFRGFISWSRGGIALIPSPRAVAQDTQIGSPAV